MSPATLKSPLAPLFQRGGCVVIARIRSNGLSGLKAGRQARHYMNKTLNTVSNLWAALRISAVDAQTWFALAKTYTTLGLPWQGGYTARQALRLDAGLSARLNALDLPGWQDTSPGANGVDILLGRASLPESAALVARFLDHLKAHPGDWLSWLYLARLREMQGVEIPGVTFADPSSKPIVGPELVEGHGFDQLRPNGGLAHLNPIGQADQSSFVLQQAQSLEPIPGESLHKLGGWRLNAGDAHGAIAVLSRLLDIRPVRFGSMMILGEALIRVGNVAAAEKAFTRASLSNNVDFLQTLANRVYAHNYWQEAIAALQKGLTIKPDSVPILLTLAKIQSEVYALAACRESLQRIQILSPNHMEAHLLEAGLMGRMGDAKGHLATLQKAYNQQGDPLSRLASSIAMTALYQDDMTAEEVADLHRGVCAPIEKSVMVKTDFSNLRTTDRRLRIAYVTGDLHRQHPVNIYMLPVLLQHDHTHFEIAVYYTGTMHDAYTRQAMSCVDRWVDAQNMDDSALHKAIVADEVDILIDLAGHTASHRLGVFAMRGAPVQASFLGYPHSTGLTQMDWLIGDATVSPPQHAHLFSEGLALLPGSVFCWASVDEYPLPAPRTEDAPVVFGSFNNATKLSPKTIALWAKILHAVPDSRLLLKAPSFRDKEVQARFTSLFAAQGIASDRLLLRGPSGLADMMQEYGDMDIALDPTPYNGGTTTQQALWMGVPVICLKGENFPARMGASFMQTLNQPDWVATDETKYIAAAVKLAQSCQSVRKSRSLFREQMAASALCEINSYTQHLELLYNKMWENYCVGAERRLIS
mgnify:CR=1 FL=1